MRKGNTVLVIEHNLDVVKVADHVVDLGPDGGEGGGQILFSGTPEDLAEEKSPTGIFLAEEFQRVAEEDEDDEELDLDAMSSDDDDDADKPEDEDDADDDSDSHDKAK